MFIFTTLNIVCDNNRYPPFTKPSRRFCVALKVGSREFIGEGNTLQAARHFAASMALKVLRNLPLPEPAHKTDLDHSEHPNSDDNVDNIQGLFFPY